MMREGKNKEIVIILFQYSVIVKGIEKKLSDFGYHVSVMEKNFERIEKFVHKGAAFIVYLPMEIMDGNEEIERLQEISETMTKSNGNMLLIGEKKYRNKLMDIIPALNHYMWFDRPVDMDTLIMAVGMEATGCIQEEAKRILIVDDDPLYARMVREWIKDIYKTDIVTAGMQAITFLLKNKVDLILLDYEMPVVNGSQVFEMLKSDPELKDIPVVFLTGVDTLDGVSRVMKLKPSGYILKSTMREELLKSIKDVFDRLN